MKLSASDIVPAGKSPKRKKLLPLNRYPRKVLSWLQGKRLQWPFYLVATSAIVMLFLSLFIYINNYVYVVSYNDQEIGIVKSSREIELFIADLTERCSSLYGMDMQLADTIVLKKELRPNSIDESDHVQDLIRQNLSFLTEAYMVTVDGSPVAPIPSEAEFSRISQIVKDSFVHEDKDVKVLDALIIEEIDLQPCSVEPDLVLSVEEVAELLIEGENPQNLSASLTFDALERGSLLSRQLYSYDYNPASFSGQNNSGTNTQKDHEQPKVYHNGVNVQTIEEVRVMELIPFDTEYTYDEELWIVEKDITVPGEEGEKEVIYHVIRENGVETERTKVSETIIKGPITQIEVYGLAQVPSVGTGQFLWPVEGEYGVTPGRGFSSFHSGIDIHAPKGTDILAADSGVVWFSGQGGSQGLYLIVYHGSYWTLYLHNSVNIASKGDKVSQGQVIAKVGETGRAYGPHLHFEVRRDDGTGEWHAYYQHEPIDPLLFFKP
jgi:murein DD-endopeptidase MepM/ murein hydrolase activator NlpD